jgi:hypothetical protein
MHSEVLQTVSRKNFSYFTLLLATFLAVTFYGSSQLLSSPGDDQNVETVANTQNAVSVPVKVVGAGDSQNAVVVPQDGAWYFDFGKLSRAELETGYPEAFKVVTENGKAVAEYTAVVDTSEDAATNADAFDFNFPTEYKNEDGTTDLLFTILFSDKAADGSNAFVVKINGTTVDGAAFTTVFVATLQVE